MEPSKIGKIQFDGTLGDRDAFHVPCVLVTAKQHLMGGEKVKFTDSSNTRVENVPFKDTEDYHAIVDPFLNVVKPKEMFYVCIKPSLVGKLIHNFDINLSQTEDIQPVYDECSSCYGESYVEDDDDDDYNDSCRGCY